MVNQFFNLNSYYSILKTKNLGRPCIYLDLVNSTIEIAPNYPPNTIVLAKEQLKGRGQRNNVWQSPIGCAMGSLQVALKKHSYLSNRLCFLQHILALSISTTLEQLNPAKLGLNRVKLKWPNDIVYLNETKSDRRLEKLGGILVNTRESGDFYDVTLSFGLNVFNREPTTCLSEILGSTNEVSIELVVADTMNNLENLTTDLDEPKFQKLKRDYTERCLQINQTVHDPSHGSVLVTQVNDDGYLVGTKNDSTRDLCVITNIL